jgi:hypothetical protein
MNMTKLLNKYLFIKMRISYWVSLGVLTEAKLGSSWFKALFNRGYVL